MPESKNIHIAQAVLKACMSGDQRMHPRRFCRRWYGLEEVRWNGQNWYTEAQIVAMESDRGYRE